MINRRIKRIDKAIGKLTDNDIVTLTKSLNFGNRIEGSKGLVNLENLLFTMKRVSIDGLQNTFNSYDSQVIETYYKYNNLRDFGNWQTKAIIDIRTGFISGEGVSITSPNDKTRKWLHDFLTFNKFNGSFFTRAVKGGEMTGKSLIILKYDANNLNVKMIRIPYGGIENDSHESIEGVNYKVDLLNDYDYSGDYFVYTLEQEDKKPIIIGSDNFEYIILGGDDTAINNTTTRVGMILTEIENYDRALKEIRLTNYYVNRITPYFKAKNNTDAKTVSKNVNESNWKIGKALITTADFKYEVPSSNAHTNNEKEMQANAKVIASVTGIPIHWIGHTEIMANRSTAESLYETIKNGTIIDRNIWSESIKSIIIKAQTIDINSGSSVLDEVDIDIEVKIPVISFSQFKDNISALSTAFRDKAISIDDYRNFIPGIDPIQTQIAIDKAKEEEVEVFKTEVDEELMNELKNKGDINGRDDKGTVASGSKKTK